MATIDNLDADIASLQARLATLHAHRTNLTSVLLSQPHLSTRLQAPASKPSSNTDPALLAITQQSTRNHSNIHRACAGVTAYKVRDPDPHAINDGAILGVSIDVALSGKFIETYHALLNWVESNNGSKTLRIHKHTIPPCIPLQALANKYLPTAGKNGDEEVQQDLVRFGRSLRKELVSWHLRVRAIDALRKEANLTAPKPEYTEPHKVLNAFTSDDEDEASSEAEEDDAPARILDIEANTAARQVMVTWSDRRTAMLSVSKDGRVEKAVCKMRDGARDAEMSRKALGPIGGLVKRLKA
ncbi:hypothetical protein CC86DRAFT_374743 [Ophiobolus disseminans]|uniref:Cenp-O kinetochore centromere component n=1 Tax=Ophiobolus disseminans TaxID=1469910 RepID=A0A6A6ZH64_9PLEO|nr:hypothetical protein CC86DRAFT_374743 [Ophiobolus disseminans]